MSWIIETGFKFRAFWMPFHRSPVGLLVHKIKHYDSVMQRWQGLISRHEGLREENTCLRHHLNLDIRVEGLPYRERMRLIELALGQPEPAWESDTRTLQLREQLEQYRKALVEALTKAA